MLTMSRVMLLERSICLNKENNEHGVNIFALLVWYVREGGYCFFIKFAYSTAGSFRALRNARSA